MFANSAIVVFGALRVTSIQKKRRYEISHLLKYLHKEANKPDCSCGGCIFASQGYLALFDSYARNEVNLVPLACEDGGGWSSCSIICPLGMTSFHMSLIVRTPVFGVSDLVRHKPDSTVTDDSRGLKFCI